MMCVRAGVRVTESFETFILSVIRAVLRFHDDSSYYGAFLIHLAMMMETSVLDNFVL